MPGDNVGYGDYRGPKKLAKIIDWAKQKEREQPLTVCARSPPELVSV